MSNTTSVLIVDDDRELAQMLTEYLTAEGFVTTVAHDGSTALNKLATNKYELVILDVMLPSLNGFDVLRNLRQTLSVPVIMLTAHGTDVDRIVGLELGADDYLSKPFNPRELVARIRAVLRRFSSKDNASGSPAPPVTVGQLRLDPATFGVTLEGKQIRLTGTEFRVLEMLMRTPGQVQSRDLLTERVLGRKLTPYDRSIDTHVSNLRRKLGLGVPGLPEIRSIRGTGYVLTAQGEEPV